MGSWAGHDWGYSFTIGSYIYAIVAGVYADGTQNVFVVGADGTDITVAPNMGSAYEGAASVTVMASDLRVVAGTSFTWQVELQVDGNVVDRCPDGPPPPLP